MADIKYNVFRINPDDFSQLNYLPDESLERLVTPVELSTVFDSTRNFIQLSYYTLNNVRLLTVPNYTNYSILSGDTVTNTTGNSEVSIDPLADYKAYYDNTTEVRALYHFLTDPYRTNNQNQTFYIESISSDRREARLISRNLNSLTVEEITNRLVNRFQTGTYAVDLHLYNADAQDNSFYTCININFLPFRSTTAVVLRFSEALPASIQVNTIVSILEKISDSVAFEINTVITPDKPVIPTLRSANFNVEVDTQVTEPTQYYNYNELFSFPTNNTYRELNSLFNEKGAQLSVDYSDFSNFINFSSAEERLRNFEYKLQLIESYQGSLDSIDNNIPTYSGAGISGSREYFQKLINGILDNFDHYERHLFYESGSTSWPKGNSTRPYTNVSTSTGAGTTWFNAEVQDAILYDAQNPDILTNTVPAYLKEDPNNRPYELFIHMVAQHFDNLWLYTDAVSKKYNSDNRLNRGVSKDLVEDLLKNFGVKLYTSNRSADDLFRYFTANSYQIDDLEPNLDPIITGSNNPVSQNDYQKEIYKRIYHNLPLLMKSKGTERGLRALINCFGIPSDTLKIRLYGGQSSEDLPFFGGQQAFTGSLDKVRLNNTGSIVEGDTVSQYTSIFKLDNYFTQDLHSIEVGFSPTHNVDEYIISQSAVLFPDTPFDIDDYIGDPREIASNTYFALRDYADTIFNGVNSYDLKDFVRFIKFFDNVIFRMVRDFIPARTVADTGIIVKPHLLERSKYEAPVMSWTQPEYSGSINTAFITGSDGGAYESFASGSVNGSLLTSYIERVITPSGTIVHSWTDSNNNTVYVRSHEEARFDGQLSGSHIVVSTGELNDENPYKTLDYKDIIYDIRFIKEVPANACLIQSLGSSTSPYVIRPTENPYDLSTLFLNGTLAGFDYTVDGDGSFRDPGAFNFDFSFGNQYSAATVVATSGSCTATTVAIKVTCDAVVNLANIPTTEVFTDITYDLTSWFTPNSNSANTIYVNGIALTSGQAQEYIFSGDEGDLVDVKFQDNVDSTCRIQRTFTLAGCSLNYVAPPITVTATVVEVLPNGNTGTYTCPAYDVRSAFAGTRDNPNDLPNTIYKVAFNYIPGSGPNSGSLQTFGPVDIATTGSNGQPVVISNAASNYSYQDLLQVEYPSLMSTLAAVSADAEAIQSVAFTARNSNQCTAGTPNFIIPGPTTITAPTSITVSYSATSPFYSNGACGLMPNTTIYYYETGGITAILEQGLNIYSDQFGTLAPAGYYSNNNQTQPGTEIYRQWNGNAWISTVVNCS